ncbi:energy transducer TonB, partial [Corallococcus sicarius]|uniref:energy transducer TonB n=1 Tax=Corallococcus sicarius TaxID=2316726 RepID=UPI0011C3988B
WGGALIAATVTHGVALALALSFANRPPPAQVKPPEPELALMAYAPPPPPLGGGLQAKQAPSEPVKSVARKPRPMPRDLVVPAKVPEPVKPEEPTPPVEATAKDVAPEPSAAVASAPVGPGVPQGVVGGVEGGTVGGLAGGRVGGLGSAPALYSPREVMKLPVLLDGKPDYPRRAREDGITGVVMVYVVIGADGRVEPAYTRIQRSVPGLDDAAIESVTRWRFSPALGHDGRPVRVKVVIPVKFALK